jgi:hypothetical protein
MFYNAALDKWTDAVEIENIDEAESLLVTLTKHKNSQNVCPDCDALFANLLIKNFYFALQANDFETVMQTLLKLKRNNSLKTCPDCLENLKETLSLKLAWAFAQGDDNVNEMFNRLMRFEDQGICPKCAQAAYDNLKNQLDNALNEGAVDFAELILSKLEKVDGLERCPDCKSKLERTAEALPARESFRFYPVSIGEYAIPHRLKRYFRFMGDQFIKIDAPFSVQSGEVTIAEYGEFFNSLPEEEQAKLGGQWKMSGNGNELQDSFPVENITKIEAEAYANWARERTQWNLQLPTTAQWAASAIAFENEATTPIFIGTPMPELRADVDHLIGNLREWSSDSCNDGGFRLLGENYMTASDDIGHGYCAADHENWSGLGFRLVRLDYPNEKVESFQGAVQFLLPKNADMPYSVNNRILNPAQTTEIQLDGLYQGALKIIALPVVLRSLDCRFEQSISLKELESGKPITLNLKCPQDKALDSHD